MSLYDGSFGADPDESAAQGTLPKGTRGRAEEGSMSDRASGMILEILEAAFYLILIVSAFKTVSGIKREIQLLRESAQQIEQTMRHIEQIEARRK